MSLERISFRQTHFLLLCYMIMTSSSQRPLSHSKRFSRIIFITLMIIGKEKLSMMILRS